MPTIALNSALFDEQKTRYRSTRNSKLVDKKEAKKKLLVCSLCSNVHPIMSHKLECNLNLRIRKVVNVIYFFMLKKTTTKLHILKSSPLNRITFMPFNIYLSSSLFYIFIITDA